jgi:hypothetical protein
LGAGFRYPLSDDHSLENLKHVIGFRVSGFRYPLSDDHSLENLKDVIGFRVSGFRYPLSDDHSLENLKKMKPCVDVCACMVVDVVEQLN